MLKFLWFITIITLPLVSSEFLRFAGLPLCVFPMLTLFFLKFISGEISIYNNKILRYFIFGWLIYLSVVFLDLNRSYNEIALTKTILKLIVLIMFSIELVSNLAKYGLNFFIKWFSLATIVTITLLFIRSYFIIGADYFMVSMKDDITESGKNQLAFFLGLFINFLIGSFFFFKEKKQKITMFFFIALTFYYIFYTDSRGSLLASVLPMGIIYLLPKKKENYKVKKKIKFIALKLISITLFIIVALLGGIELGVIGEKFNFLYESVFQNTKSFSDDLRRNLLSMSFNDFVNNPFLGIGTDNFVEVHGYATHNNYLQILAENGFFVFITLIIVIFLSLKSAYKKYYFGFKKEAILPLILLISSIVYLNLINGIISFTAFIFFSIIIYTINNKNA